MTRQELEAAILDTINRPDLSASMFFSMGEADIRSRLRHWRTERLVTLTVTDGAITLPDDYLSTISASTEDEGQLFRGAVTQPSTAHGLQMHIAEELEGATIDLKYYSRLDRLSSANSSNWVSEDHPDLYLYAGLRHTAPYLIEDARIATWDALYESALARIERERVRQINDGPPMRQSIHTPTRGRR